MTEAGTRVALGSIHVAARWGHAAGGEFEPWIVHSHKEGWTSVTRGVSAAAATDRIRAEDGWNDVPVFRSDDEHVPWSDYNDPPDPAERWELATNLNLKHEAELRFAVLLPYPCSPAAVTSFELEVTASGGLNVFRHRLPTAVGEVVTPAMRVWEFSSIRDVNTARFFGLIKPTYFTLNRLAPLFDYAHMYSQKQTHWLEMWPSDEAFAVARADYEGRLGRDLGDTLAVQRGDNGRGSYQVFRSERAG